MMTTPHVPRSRFTRGQRTTIAVLSVVVLSLGSMSAHVVRGLTEPALATAFASSPSAGTDALIPIVWGGHDTGLRVACFYVANTSPARTDEPDWPRITAVGFELPGALSGFTLASPLDGDWELVEGVAAALPGRADVTLDFVIAARVNPDGRPRQRPDRLLGIPPGQQAVRGNGTRFCVTGHFPDALAPNVPTTIEQILNGVVVQFHRVRAHGPSVDLGLWDNPQRVIPLYP